MRGFLAANSWLPWALASASFAALTAVFGKIGVENINSDFATFLRTIVVLVSLGLIVIFFHKTQPLASVTPKTYFFLCLSGLATGASWLCYFKALQQGDAARVAPVDKLSVVFVALFATLFLGERLSPLNWAGVLLITVGAVLLALKI